MKDKNQWKLKDEYKPKYRFKYPLRILKRDPSLQSQYYSHNYDERFVVTFFGNTCQKEGVKANLLFDQLVKHIAMPQRKAVFWDSEDPRDREWEKACQKCFAPVSYKENRRLGEKVEYFTCMVWDIDDGKSQYDDILKILQDADLRFIMHTSYSHTPQKHKFRVVFPLVKPIPVAYFEAYAEIVTRAFMEISGGQFIDQQAIGNKASTYNCAYLTPHYRGDWNDGDKMICIFDKVQERFEKLQRTKSLDFLNKQFSSSAQRHRHVCHIDDRRDRVARLNVDPTVRSQFASFIGARKRGQYWEKWECPSCNKKDATSFHEKHGRAYCNHNSSCGGQSWLLPELASLKGWNG